MILSVLFTTTELILLSIQILLVPLARYFLKQEKKEIVHNLSKLIEEYYSSLENLIDSNKDKINNIKEEIKHRSELSKIKQGISQARIKDIEIYLKKQNGFQTREINEIDDSNFL